MTRLVRRVSLRLAPASLALAAALAATRHVLADEAHPQTNGPIGFDPDPLIWGGLSLGAVFVVLLASRLMLLREVVHQTAGKEDDIGYLAAITRFSRNARLFLAYSLLAELGSGIWSVMFNLYLLRVGFPVAFVGTFWLVNMMCHGLASLPAGLVADRFGRRRSFFMATSLSLAAQGTLLFSTDPLAILVLAGAAGFGDAFHSVTGAPFMMENSEPDERPHLFSLNSSFLQFSRFGGNLAGGLLPLALAVALDVQPADPTAARGALVLALPLTILALLPLAFMREKPVELGGSLGDLVTLRNVAHFGLIARLTVLSAMVGIGFGLTVRFFNIFFQEARHATDEQVGAILALGAIASAGSVLISPVLAQAWGKAKGVFITQAFSVPFLLLMAFVPSLTVVTTLFLVRGALAGVGMPLRNQLQMEFVTSGERGTTAGFTHMAFDIGGGLGAGLAGLMITDSGFGPAFSVAALLILMPAFLYYAFFDRVEKKARERPGVILPPVSASSA